MPTSIFAPGDRLLGERPLVELERGGEAGVELGPVVGLRHADRRAHVRRLHEAGEAELGLDPVAERGRVVAVVEGQPAGGGEPGRRERGLDRDLVHRQRRAEDPRADVRQVGELEEALDGAVLPVGAVEERHDDVDVGGAGGVGRAGVEGHQRGLGRVGRLGHRRAFDLERVGEAGRAGFERGGGLPGEEPAAVGVDRDRDDVVAGRVEGLGDRDRGDSGHVVLGGPAAEEQQDASSWRHVTCSTARIPRPMMNRPSRPQNSSRRPRMDRRYW